MKTVKYCASYKIITVTPTRLLETSFRKKGLLSNENFILPSFFRNIEFDTPLATNFHNILAPNLAPKDLIPTLARLKCVPERLEM